MYKRQVHDAADYHKVSKAEMIAGFEKLTQVRRWIGQGATEQQLCDESRAKGLSEVQSYHNIYRVFYGESAIALEKVGDRYRVINGYHRLAVARELGWTCLLYTSPSPRDRTRSRMPSSA